MPQIWQNIMVLPLMDLLRTWSLKLGIGASEPSRSISLIFVISTVGGYISTVGGYCRYSGGYHQYFGGVFSFVEENQKYSGYHLLNNRGFPPLVLMVSYNSTEHLPQYWIIVPKGGYCCTLFVPPNRSIINLDFD